MPSAASPDPSIPEGDTTTAAEPRIRRAERLALVALLTGMLVSLGWFVHPWYDPTNDGAMYILTTRELLAGEGYSMLGAPFRIRPPGFSLMLAPILAARGTDFGAIHLMVSLWGVLGCGLLFFWARRRLGPWLALLVALTVWLNPGYQLLCNQTMSDVPGTALMLACLLVERWSAARPSWRRDAGLGFFVAATAYVRSINVLLVPAIVAMRFARRLSERGDAAERWGAFAARAGALVLATVLVQLPWSLRNAAVAPPPPADQTLLYDYSTAFWHEDMGDPASRRLTLGDVLARVPDMGARTLGVLGNRVKDRTGGAAADAPFAFVFLAGVLFVLFKRREAAELFVLGALALFSVYFGFAPRLLLPVFVLALPATVEALGDLVRAIAARLAPARAGVAGNAVAGLALLGLLVVDLEPRAGWDKIEGQHVRLTEMCSRFLARSQEDAVFASHRAWHYAVLMDRPVYALEFVVKRHVDPATGRIDPRPLEELIDQYAINTVILSPVRQIDREALPYFEERYGGAGSDPFARVYRVRD